MIRIIGIDPGSYRTGYGIVDCKGNSVVHCAHGVLTLGRKALPLRLHEIYQGLITLLTEYRPTVCAIEEVFVYKNVHSALQLGQARGAALVAIASHGIPVEEYAAVAIKKAIVGYGHASKEQMQHMVRHLLHLTTTPLSDAADALAAAICYAHQFAFTERLKI